jgi:hypothetical protein
MRVTCPWRGPLHLSYVARPQAKTRALAKRSTVASLVLPLLRREIDLQGTHGQEAAMRDQSSSRPLNAPRSWFFLGHWWPSPASWRAALRGAVGALLAWVAFLLGAVAVPMLVSGCGATRGGSGGGAGAGAGDGVLVFHGTRSPFDGFSADTGYLPAGSPVQVRFQLAGSGTVTVDAKAVASGDASNPTVNGQPGSGQLALDAGVTLKVSLKVDVGPLHFDGPLMGVPDIEVRFGGMRGFDPFLLHDQVQVTAQVPDTEVAAVPLMAAAGIPGTLHIHAGGTVTTGFGGTCAGLADGAVQYLGSTTTSGMLALSATVDIDVPLAGSMSFGPFMVPAIAVGPLPAPLDLGTERIAGTGAAVQGEAATAGTCAAGAGPDGGVAGGSTDAGGAGGAGDGGPAADRGPTGADGGPGGDGGGMANDGGGADAPPTVAPVTVDLDPAYWSYSCTDQPDCTTTIQRQPAGPDGAAVQISTNAAFAFTASLGLPGFDLSGYSTLSFSVQARNPNPDGWQGNFPMVTLMGGMAPTQFQPDTNLLPLALGDWVSIDIPLSGGNGWSRFDPLGEPDLSAVYSIAFGADTWGDQAYDIWIDNVTLH